MGAIDVGTGAVDFASTRGGGYTRIDVNNPANDSGTLSNMEIWANTNLSNVKCGTFSGAAPNFDDRDYETLGTVASGSKQTFVGLDCDVVTNDYLGIYYSAGDLDHDTAVGAGHYWVAGDKFGGGSNAYTLNTTSSIAIYATGYTDTVTSISRQVNAGNDDAGEKDDGTGFDASGSTLSMKSSTVDANRRNAGFVFDNITVPSGVIIVSATLQLYIFDSLYDDPNVDIYGNDVDDANDFTTEADVTSRVTTTASVSWVDTAILTGWKNSPDIKTVIQEIVDRGGWASGNSICILVKGKSDASKSFSTYAYEQASATAAKLVITYAEVSGATGAMSSVGKLIEAGII